MKKLLLISCSILLVACSASPTKDSLGSGNRPVATTTVSPSARASLEVSDAATCQTLFGTDGGLVSASGQFLADITDLDDAAAADAVAVADALNGVADTSSEQFRDLLTVMQEPFRDLAKAHENGGDKFELDPSRFKAAANEVIALCEPLLQDNTATSSGSESTSPSALQVSEETTCIQLSGSDHDGPFFKAVTFVTELDGTSDMTTAVDRARALNEELRGIARFAQNDMALLLDEFLVPLNDIIGLADGTQSDSDFDKNAWKAATTELVTICKPYDSGTGN